MLRARPLIGGLLAAAAAVVLAGTGQGAADETLAAESYGAAPGASAEENTRAIQRALADAAARGGAVVTLTTPGTFDLAVQGPNPHRPGHLFCLQVEGDDTTLRLGPRVVVRLADGQQTDAGGPVDVVLLTAERNVALDGGGSIVGNTGGQRGWTRGYAQEDNGNLVLVQAGHGRGGAGVRIEDLTLEDAFSNAILTRAPPDRPTQGVRIARVNTRDTGEGPMVVNATGVELLDSAFENRTIAGHPGDGFELSNVSGFAARDLTVRGRLGGSAIDLYGARHGRLQGFLFEGVTEGVMVQENTTFGTASEDVLVSDGLVTVVAPEGNGAWTKGRLVRGVTFERVRVLGPGSGVTYGFQIAGDDVPQQGPVTLRDCEARGHVAGLLVKTVADLTVEGGTYSDNRGSPFARGIHWLGQTAARGPDDTRGLVIRGVTASGNRAEGIYLDYRDPRGRDRSGAEPSGLIAHCRLAGNGGRGLGVLSQPGAARDLAGHLDIDDVQPDAETGVTGRETVAGLRFFTPRVARLTTLLAPHHGQRLVLRFDHPVRVVDASRPGGRDIHLWDGRDLDAGPGQRLCLSWDGAAWREVWREAGPSRR